MSKKSTADSIKSEFNRLLDLLTLGLENRGGTVSALAMERGISLEKSLPLFLERELSTRKRSATLLLAKSSVAGKKSSQVAGNETLEQLGQMIAQLGKSCDLSSSALERSSILSIQASLLQNVLASYQKGNTAEALTMIKDYKKREEERQKRKSSKKGPSTPPIPEEMIL